MNGKHFVGRRVSSVELYDSVGPITAVAILLDDNNEILVGDDTGYTLEIECPYGTQAMAENILAQVSGQTYKGFRAQGAELDATAELGDGVTVNGTYSVLAYRSVNFGPGHLAEIAAPGESTLEHEYSYKSPVQRQTDRKIKGAYSLITKTAEEIRLEVGVENQRTAASIEALEKQFGEDLSDLSDNITEMLKSYSTITQTATSISSAVSECKTYTDDETGKVIAELENYSTITQTATSISSAVSGLINGNQAQALIDQSLEGIELSVSNGSTSSTISLKAGETVIDSANISFSGFVTFSGLSGGTTTIDGACIKTGTISADRIDADNLVLTNSANIANNFIVDSSGNVTINGNINLSGGTITWGSNNPADGSGISASEAKTIINNTLVSSPTIAGGVFYNLPQTHSLEMSASGSDYGTFRLYNQYYGSVPYFSIYDDTYGCLDLYAAGNKFLRYDYGTYPQGKWDFKNATLAAPHGTSLPSSGTSGQVFFLHS